MADFNKHGHYDFKRTCRQLNFKISGKTLVSFYRFSVLVIRKISFFPLEGYYRVEMNFERDI